MPSGRKSGECDRADRTARTAEEAAEAAAGSAARVPDRVRIDLDHAGRLGRVHLVPLVRRYGPPRLCLLAAPPEPHELPHRVDAGGPAALLLQLADHRSAGDPDHLAARLERGLRRL